MNRMINLISDTVTLPTPKMKEFMMSAPLGDDVFADDPTVNKLQDMMANMFQKEAALFCPSGTMTNQLAIKCHTNPLDELICDHYSHVYQYETGGYAFNSAIAVNPLIGRNGKITAAQVKEAVKPVYDWLPISKLVVLENSCNKGGGSYYQLEEIKPIQSICEEHSMKLHLDGARLFNVLVETKEKCADYGKSFDSISICLSKGLGAPVGSVLIGDKEFIRQARRFRKVMGGGMRQAGLLAAACIYAMENNIERLKDDNNRAAQLGEVLSRLDYITTVRPVKTNIVIFDLIDGLTANEFIDYLKTRNILCSAFGPQTVRFVTHMGIDDQSLEQTIQVLKEYKY